MLAHVMAAALVLLQGPAVDTAGIYTAVLNDIRTSHPGLPVALAESRSAVRCMPHCQARLRDADGVPAEASTVPVINHSPDLVHALRERGLVQARCPVPEGVFGCGAFPDHLFVGLGDISEAPEGGPPRVEGGLWVKAALLVPGDTSRAAGKGRHHPDGYGIWYLVREESNGTWTVQQRLPAFFL